MRNSLSFPRVLLVSWVLLSAIALAAIKVKTDHDPTFDFSKARTWAWNENEAGRVIMARTADDRPEEVKSRAEPVIKDAVATQLARRKLVPAGAEAPDLTVAYSLLITLGTSAQYVGQFAPSVPEWGLVPFSGATQALRGIEQGSLLLDMTAGGKVVWRGAAQAEIKPGMTADKRHRLIQDAVREVLTRYPPRK